MFPAKHFTSVFNLNLSPNLGLSMSNSRPNLEHPTFCITPASVPLQILGVWGHPRFSPKTEITIHFFLTHHTSAELRVESEEDLSHAILIRSPRVPNQQGRGRYKQWNRNPPSDWTPPTATELAVRILPETAGAHLPIPPSSPPARAFDKGARNATTALALHWSQGSSLFSLVPWKRPQCQSGQTFLFFFFAETTTWKTCSRRALCSGCSRAGTLETQLWGASRCTPTTFSADAQ